jgi:hypothetical protein
LSCSCSVQLSLDLVIVYGFRIFLLGSSRNDAVLGLASPVVVEVVVVVVVVVDAVVVGGGRELRPVRPIFIGLSKK